MKSLTKNPTPNEWEWQNIVVFFSIPCLLALPITPSIRADVSFSPKKEV